MSRASTIRLTLAIALSAGASPACKADESVLDAIFSCDPEAGDAQCGTDEDGKPMTCYVGSAQLGGKAFCTKACDPTREYDSSHVCTSSGALLEVCHPDANDIDCPGELQCYRTDVLFDQGLCMWVPICPYGSGDAPHDNGQCGVSHQVCAGDLLLELAANSPLADVLRTNNLHCVSRTPCDVYECSGSTLTEVCPSSFYRGLSGLPVTCSVQCDRFTCPPNFACIGTSSAGAPPICLPGAPGMRCTSSEDCLVGDCIDTGAGFSECTLTAGCDTDDECLILSSSPPFACAGGYCVSTVPFQGANCEDPSDCSPEARCGSEACPPRKCTDYSPALLHQDHGECRFSCNPTDGCPAFGGLPHACLEDGTCYPGTFGVPCSSPTDCYANLTCETVPMVEPSVSSPKICTAPCGENRDCTPEVNPWVTAGYCVNAVGYCQIGAQPGMPCGDDAHCLYRDCLMPEGVCAPEPP